MRWQILAAVAAVAAVVGACGGSGGGPDTCLPECTANRSYDAIAYHLRGSLDWEARELLAEEDITVVLAGAPVIELDARVTVEAVSANGDELGFVHDQDGSLLRVDLGPLGGDGGGELTFHVKYRAAASGSLVFTGPRDDDPVDARVAYSDSEPDRGRGWLVSNDHPADRARFSVEIEVAAGEDVISNGERTGDVPGNGRRVVSYAIEQPLPTYEMAFAAGELVHTESAAGRVPLAAWYRRGAAIDAAAILAVNARQMAVFEALLGPYRFARYAVVMLPGFPGGMENATITFVSESSGQGVVSEGLFAHELGHQWFGDWITMRDYRDVWIKEGMATLLAAEASRPTRDAAGSGRLFGTAFSFDPDDAIVDDSLSGLGRYTTGPYERSAWTLTQVRARLGEAAFWGVLRGVLDGHALDSVDGESFVRAFAPQLDGATIARWLAVLDDHGAPAIDISTTGNAVTLALSDPAGFLFDPISLTVVDAGGVATPRTLAPGTPLTVDVPVGGYLAPDERDVHPYWHLSFTIDNARYFELSPLLVPGGGAGALAAFEDRSAGAQERALSIAGMPGLVPDALGAIHGALDSSQAKRGVVLEGCRRIFALPAGDPDIAAWAAALAPVLAAPAQPVYLASFGRCARALPPSLLAELAELADLGAAIPAPRLGRLEYLLGFDYGADETLALVSRIAASAPSVRHRDLALDRLGQQARSSYSGVPAGSLDVYRAFFRARLAGVTSSTRLLILWRGIVGLSALDALPDVAALLHKVRVDPFSQRRIVCEAFQIGGTSAAWAAFQTAAQPWEELSAEAAAVLRDPAACNP
jgi:hypothetical protein